MRPTQGTGSAATETWCEEIAAILAAGFLRLVPSDVREPFPRTTSATTENPENSVPGGLEFSREMRLSVRGG